MCCRLGSAGSPYFLLVNSVLIGLCLDWNMPLLALVGKLSLRKNGDTEPKVYISLKPRIFAWQGISELLKLAPRFTEEEPKSLRS